MNFEKIAQYNYLFFENQVIEQEVNKNNSFFETILNRGEFLKEGKIIFDDPMDMEAVRTPYDLCLAHLLESPNGDPEWCYMVSRNGYLVDLGILFAYTKDEVYFELWKKLLFTFIDWQEKSPHVWRSLDVGLRLNNWMKSFVYFSDLEHRLSTNEKKQLKEAVLKQIIFLKDHFPTKNYLSNWGVLAVTGILATSQLLPGLVSSEVEMWGWATLTEAFKLQFFDDGIHWEQSPLYHHQVLMCAWQLWLNSIYLALPFSQEIEHILRRGIQSSLYYCDQKYYLLPLHDSDAVDFTYVYNLYSLSGFLEIEIEQNPGVFYVGNKIKRQKRKPLPSLFRTGESGFLAYKDSNVYLTLFNGRHGSGHGHASLGSLTFTYQGNTIFTDPGRYTYQEESLRVHLKEEFSHSSLIIDEIPLTRITSSWTYESMAEPLYHRSIENKEQVIFEVGWKGRLNGKLVIFKRKIIYFKLFTVLIIVNTSECIGDHFLTTRYQLDEKIVPELHGRGIYLTGSPFVLQNSTESMPSINDKIGSKKYNEKNSYKELTFQQKFQDELLSYEYLYPKGKILIEKIDCYQNNQTNFCPDIFYFGLRLTHLAGKYSNEYYHSARDTYLGDKLYLSEYGRLLYGKDKLYVKKIGEKE